MFRHPRFIRRIQHGVSLVELMVALVIGAIAVLVIMQIFQLSEGARRTTVGGDDAQVTGAIAVTTLQRDIQQAGYGTSDFALLGCPLNLPGGWSLPALAPITINPQTVAATPLLPGADATTDTLLIVYGSQGGSPEGDLVATQSPQSLYTVATPRSFAVGDMVVAAQSWMTTPGLRPAATPCPLTIERVQAVTAAPNPPTVSVPIGVAGMANGSLYNFGQTLQVLGYRVRGGNLTVCDFVANNCSNVASVDDPTVWVPIGNGIVSLRAQYGRDTTVPGMDAVVDVYDQNTPAAASAALQCDWSRIAGVRLVVVARSGEMSRVGQEPTNAANRPRWAASDAAPIRLEDSNPDWERFRYRTFETTAPLRNIAWQGVPIGC